MKKLTSVLGTALLAGSVAALAQSPSPLPLKQAVNPKIQDCAENIQKEKQHFADTLKAGLASGAINPQERAALEKSEAEFQALEKKALEDGKISPEECKGLQTRMQQQGHQLQAAMSVRGVRLPHKHPRNARLADCTKELQAERQSFAGALQSGIDSGLISPQERATLEKKHQELVEAENKALEDGKMEPQECKAIHGRIAAERRALHQALAVRGVALPHKKPVNPAVADCSARIQYEREKFSSAMAAGLASGKIDANEKAALEKTHGDLEGMEKKALEDGKVSPQECADISQKIAEESHKLRSAMTVRGVRLHHRQPRSRHPEVLGCAEAVQAESLHLEGVMSSGVASGHIDAKEKAALDKTHAELMSLEHKVLDDHKMTPQECKAAQARIASHSRNLRHHLSKRGARTIHKHPRNPQLADCTQAIQNEKDSFTRLLESGVQSGKIDAKEKAALDKKHAELTALEDRALEDGKVSPQECKTIHASISAETRMLRASLGMRGINIARKHPKHAHPQVVDCTGQIQAETNRFAALMKVGLDSGKIDAKEKADLEKVHGDVLAAENKALEDGKITPEECKVIHGQIVAENQKLDSALDRKKIALPEALRRMKK